MSRRPARPVSGCGRAGVDLVAMDCMSYMPDTKAAIRAAAGVPAILAVTATARVLQELLS